MDGSRALCMLATLVAVSCMHSVYSNYQRTYLEAFRAEESVVTIDREQMMENVRLLRDAVISEKSGLMMLVTELDTLIQRTVVLESSGFLSLSDQTRKTGGEPDCEDVEYINDFELSNEQIETMYQKYMMHMRNIKQFKSGMFMTMAAIRAKINLLEPDLSYEEPDLERPEGSAPPTANEISVHKHEQRFGMMKEIEAMLEDVRASLDAFYEDFRNMSKLARQLKCVNAHMLELIHRKHNENFVLYQLTKT